MAKHLIFARNQVLNLMTDKSVLQEAVEDKPGLKLPGRVLSLTARCIPKKMYDESWNTMSYDLKLLLGWTFSPASGQPALNSEVPEYIRLGIPKLFWARHLFSKMN